MLGGELQKWWQQLWQEDDSEGDANGKNSWRKKNTTIQKLDSSNIVLRGILIDKNHNDICGYHF